MSAPVLPTPASLREKWRIRFDQNAARWLLDEGEWPQSWPLHPPSEKAAGVEPSRVAAWVRDWRDWDERHGGGAVHWAERDWPHLGRQRLPERVRCRGPEVLAGWLGERTRWRRAKSRADALRARWPSLASTLPKYFRWLADAEDGEFDRRAAVLSWLSENPLSGVYPRQIPIPGVDSKWLETNKAWARDWLAPLRGEAAGAVDLYELCGLRRLPAMLRMRVEDPALRAHIGGLSHAECPIEDAAALAWPIRAALVVENLQSGLAMAPNEGTVVLMALGYALESLPAIPWLAGARIGYWSDLDTHGFAMLNRMRAHFPQTQSLLMDADTMLRHRELWVPEPKPSPAEALTHLTEAEARTYQRFCDEWKGQRLEQERIGWNHVQSALSAWTMT